MYFCIWVFWHATVHVWMSKDNPWKWEWTDLWPPCLGVFPLQRFLLFLLHSWPWHLDSFLGSGYQTQVVKLTCPNIQIFLHSEPSPQFLFVFETIPFCWGCLRTPDLCASTSQILGCQKYTTILRFIYLCVYVCASAHCSCFKVGVLCHFLPYSLRKGLTRPEASLEDSKPHQSSCLLYSAGIIQIMLAMYIFLCIFLGFEFRFSLRHCFNLLPLPPFFPLSEDVSVHVCNCSHQTVNIYLSLLNTIYVPPVHFPVVN